MTGLLSRLDGASRLMRRSALLAGLLILLLSAANAQAQDRERILHFDSEIWVHADSSMTVHETITVVAQRQEIKRGIYRDFPTTYDDRFGNRTTVAFDILGVRRDGQPESYHTERLSNGVRLYIGQKDRLIRKGEHVYTIEYRTTRQLGHFGDFDELYWNVTGNGWAFPIERASVRVHLPKGAEALELSAYTGPEGAQGQDFTARFTNDGAAFETTRTLGPAEGLTVAVAWPPGFVAQPTQAERLGYFFDDNAALFAGLVGLSVLALYYLLVWRKVGRDPERGTVVPLYSPPKGFSPAAARYVTRMGFDDKAFAAAIVSMAVKGYLTIEEDSRKTYTLKKTGEAAKLSPGEQALARKLFSHGRREIELKQKNHKKLQAARKALREWLRTEFEKVYFVRNTNYFLPGLGVSALAIVALVLASAEPMAAAFLCVWLSIWSVAVYFLFRQCLNAWKGALATGGALQIVPALVMSLLALPFFGGEIMGLWFLSAITGVPGTLVLAGILLVNILFYHLLKAPTLLGRRVMDQIDGFADYLSVAEKDRMNLLNPPERTPELFERFLPYALALGVEQAWSEQFADVLAQAGAEAGGHGGRYRPHWYHGRSFDGDFGGFASSFGSSFAGAVSSASTAPGSSSGSGGGGSSGGGGGGGGGGGW